MMLQFLNDVVYDVESPQLFDNCVITASLKNEMNQLVN